MGFLLILPLFLIRYGLLWIVNKNALPKAAHFPPTTGKAKIMNIIYQLATIALVISICVSKIKPNNSYFYVGLPIYALGLIVLTISTINFAQPSSNGVNQNGLYHYSRNPMYIGYFLFLLGCVLLTQSIVSGIFLVIFQVSEHWVILAEEQWCKENLGESYSEYFKTVRRYI